MKKTLPILIAFLAAVAPASAKCFLMICWLDTEGTGKEFCEEHQSVEIASMEISEPRYSIYNFLVVSSFTGSNCPPKKKVSYRGVWDRIKREATETGGEPVRTHVTKCSRNPWTTKGVIHQSNAYYVACTPVLPVTSELLTQAAKTWLLTVLEPLYTRCKVNSPVGFAATPAKQNTSLPVVVAHHENQEIVWQMEFQRPGGEKKIIQPAPHPFPPPVDTVVVNQQQIAETTQHFWLAEPGLYWIRPAGKLKPQSSFLEVVSPVGENTTQPLTCFPAAFVKVGDF